jgi:hypothetical protein
MRRLFNGRRLRTLATGTPRCDCASYCTCKPELLVEGASAGTADLVCSDLPSGKHMPVIDLDVPCSLVESGTPGHYHLYIDVEMTQGQLFGLLSALALAGVVEDGYVIASQKRGYSAVRVPWKPKGVLA